MIEVATLLPILDQCLFVSALQAFVADCCDSGMHDLGLSGEEERVSRTLPTLALGGSNIELLELISTAESNLKKEVGLDLGLRYSDHL